MRRRALAIVRAPFSEGVNRQRKASGTGAYGTRVRAYDGVGNRTSEVSTPVGGAARARDRRVPVARGVNRQRKIESGRSRRLSLPRRFTPRLKSGATIGADRAFVHDAGGNITSDTRAGIVQLYTYNKRNRMDTATG